MHQFELELNHDNDRYNLVQHLPCVVPREQPLTHLVSNSSDRHLFDPKTFVHTRRKYLNAVTANTDRGLHLLQDLHPNQDLTTLKSLLQLVCIHLLHVPCLYLQFGIGKLPQYGGHMPNQKVLYEYCQRGDPQLEMAQTVLSQV